MDIADFVYASLILLIPLASIISAGSASNMLVELTPDVATIIIIVLVVVLGFLLPLIPLVVSLKKLLRDKTKSPIPYYIMFVASVVWIALAIGVIIII